MPGCRRDPVNQLYWKPPSARRAPCVPFDVSLPVNVEEGFSMYEEHHGRCPNEAIDVQVKDKQRFGRVWVERPESTDAVGVGCAVTSHMANIHADLESGKMQNRAHSSFGNFPDFKRRVSRVWEEKSRWVKEDKGGVALIGCCNVM